MLKLNTDNAVGSEWETQYSTENWNYQNTRTELPFSCEHCQKKFASHQSLANHQPVHTGKTTCNICGKVESTRSNLSRHIKMSHSGAVTHPDY